MLSDLRATLRAWLADAVPARTQIVFDAPSQVRSQSAGVVDLFLYDIREDPLGAAAAGLRVRDEAGRVRGTVLPAPRYRLSYLVTAWGKSGDDEFALLDGVLSARPGQQAVPTACLQGSLRELDDQVIAQLCPPVGSGSLPELWQALGVPMRECLDLAVVAPMVPRVEPPPPPAAAIDLRVHPHPAPGDRRIEPRRRWERTSITEQS